MQAIQKDDRLSPRVECTEGIDVILRPQSPGMRGTDCQTTHWDHRLVIGNGIDKRTTPDFKCRTQLQSGSRDRTSRSTLTDRQTDGRATHSLTSTREQNTQTQRQAGHTHPVNRSLRLGDCSVSPLLVTDGSSVRRCGRPCDSHSHSRHQIDGKHRALISGTTRAHVADGPPIFRRSACRPLVLVVGLTPGDCHHHQTTRRTQHHHSHGGDSSICRHSLSGRWSA